MVMDKFEMLQQLYQSMVAAEKELKNFSSYAVYELDGGISEWVKAKDAFLKNIIQQKNLLIAIIGETSDFTKEQRQEIETWNLA